MCVMALETFVKGSKGDEKYQSMGISVLALKDVISCRSDMFHICGTCIVVATWLEQNPCKTLATTR